MHEKLGDHLPVVLAMSCHKHFDDPVKVLDLGIILHFPFEDGENVLPNLVSCHINKVGTDFSAPLILVEQLVWLKSRRRCRTTWAIRAWPASRPPLFPLPTRNPDEAAKTKVLEAREAMWRP